MNLDIFNLKLIPYSAAGNITPVLDISSIEGISNYEVIDIKERLERDILFRNWLKNEGQKINADSVMIYFRRSDNSFVTFIGEPNAPIDNNFSDMCGNGIRSLALHILLNEKNDNLKNNFIQNGINIFAGELRRVEVIKINFLEKNGVFKVNMGRFQNSVRAISKYVNVNRLISGNTESIGFNGDKEGEPHYVKVIDEKRFTDLKSDEEILIKLRSLCAKEGTNITFNRNLFPHGINFNLALVKDNKVYISTHERNLSSGVEECLNQQKVNGVCKCCTKACGTGGAVTANAIALKGLFRNNIQTIHFGGQIDYETGDCTFMTGPAEKV